MKNIHFFDSNQYRGIISIFATAAIGAMGFVQTAVGYGIPGMDKFTVGALMSGGVACADDDVGCWFSGSIVLGLLVGGTMNQFKMETIDFSLPAITAYERLIHRIEKSMTLLFALNEFIDGGVNLDTSDLMERCLKARDDLAACTPALLSSRVVAWRSSHPVRVARRYEHHHQLHALWPVLRLLYGLLDESAARDV